MNKNIKKILLFSIFIIILIGISGVNAQEVSNDTISSDLSDNVQVSTDTVYNTDLNSNINNNDNIEKITTKQKNIKTDDSSIDITNENYDQLGTYMNQYSTLNFVDDFDGKTIDITNGVTITSSPDYTFTNSHFTVNANGVTINNLNIVNTDNSDSSAIFVNAKNNVNINNNHITVTKTTSGTTYAIELNGTSNSVINSNTIVVNAYPQAKQWINTSATNYIGIVKVSGIVVDDSDYVDVTYNDITVTNSTETGYSTSTFEGITIRNESTYVSARNNDIDVSNANYTYGITIEKSDRCNATYNTIALSSENYVCGIEVMEDKHTLLSHNTITGTAYKYQNTNLVGESFAYGIYLSANYITDMTQNVTVSYNTINLASNIVYGIEGYKISTTSASTRNYIKYNTITVTGNVSMGMGFDTTYRTYVQNNVIIVNGYNRTLGYYYEEITPITTGIELEDSTLSLSNEITDNHILVTEHNTVVDTIYAVVIKAYSSVEDNYLTSHYNGNTLNGNNAVYRSSYAYPVSGNGAYDLTQTNINQNALSKSSKSSIKKSTNTIILNSLNFDKYVTEGMFNDNVNDGDTIDIQGDLDGSLFALTINKAVNIISTTNDAYISYHTGSTGKVFTVVEGGSGSNITGLTFYNTRVSIEGVDNVLINNISYINENEQIGPNVGGFSIREESSNVNVRNSYFYTKGNFGHSTVVFAGANNILFENNTVVGETYDDNALGKIGNLVYITTYEATGNNFNITIKNNVIDARLVARDFEISTPLRLQGKNITIENNIIYNNPDSTYSTIQEQWSGDNSVYIDSLILKNNTVSGSVSIASTDSEIIDNTFDSLTISNAKITNNNIASLNAGTNSIIDNNNITKSIKISENTTLTRNYINATLNISNSNVLVNNNTISIFNQSYAIVLNGDINNITITNNGLASYNGRGVDAISSNSIEYVSENNTNAALYIIITDENLGNYIDMDDGCKLKSETVKNGDYLTFVTSSFSEFATTSDVKSVILFNNTADSPVIMTLNSDSDVTIMDSYIQLIQAYEYYPKVHLYNSIVAENEIANLDYVVLDDSSLLVYTNWEERVGTFGSEYSSSVVFTNEILGEFPNLTNITVMYYPTPVIELHYSNPSRYPRRMGNPIVERPVNINGIDAGNLSVTFTFEEGSSYSNITNVVFDGIVTINNANNLKFTNCTFNNGVTINEGTYLAIDSCTFNNEGITLNSGLYNNITNNIMNLTTTAIDMTSSSNNIINNNHILTTATNTILSNGGRNNNISNNYLVAETSVGDFSVSGTNITSENNTPLLETDINITIESTEEKTSESITSTNNITIKVTANDENVNNGEVTVYVNDVAQEPITLTDGEANTTIMLNQAGLHFIKVLYTSSSLYGSSLKKLPYIEVLGIGTTTSIADVNAKIGENVDITITVSDESENAVSGSATLTTPTESVTVDIVNGTGIYTAQVTKEWMNSNITALFQGSDILSKSTITITPTVNKGDSIINYEVESDLNTITIIASVTDVNNQIIDNGMLYLKNNAGETLDVKQLDGNNITFTVSHDEGLDYILEYRGNNYYSKSNISISVVDPSLNITTTTFTVGENATISASIYYGDEVYTSINKGKVIFKVNGKTLKDASGKVIYAKVVNGTATIENYEIPSSWNNDTTIEAVYSGSIQCDSLRSEKTNMTITPKALTLETSDITATIGSNITLKATLSDNTINTGKMLFKINGKTVKDADGKVIYAKVVNGTASVDYLLDGYKTGTYTITCIYTSSVYGSMQQNATLTITKA
jgi:hypothetical protein